MVNRRILIAYILLVAVPLLGLLGILEAGRNLAAPPSVSGSWKFDSLQVTEGGTCGRSMGSASMGGLAIVQSGRAITVAISGLGAEANSARLEGNILETSLNGANPGRAPLSIRGLFSQDKGEDILTGILSVSGCQPSAFRAIRRKPSSR